MSTDLITRKETEQEELPMWGEANAHRGQHFYDIAVEFAKDFPIGKDLKAEEFDEWVQRRGLLNVPIGAPKHSDAWKAYLMRRHELRFNINKAATHPRMGDKAFTIEAVRQGYWSIRSPQVAIAKSELTRKVQSVFVTKRKKLDYLMQSADWSLLPVHERIIAEDLYIEVNNVQKRFNLDADQLTEKFVRLERKIKTAVEHGLIKPVNHGIEYMTRDDETTFEELE